MQSKLGKRTDLKQCCTDRRDAQMRCDATRIPQLTTATTTSKHTFTQKRRQEVEGKEEEAEEEKEVVEEAQQTFLFKSLSRQRQR